MYRLAKQHQMVGIVAPLLSQMCDGQLPDSPEAPWKQTWHALALVDLAQWAALEEILRSALTYGLRPMLLKGFSVHRQAYSPEAARGASDIDLFVRPSEIPSMIQCLGTLGFSFRKTDGLGRPVSDVSVVLEQDSEAAFFRPADGVYVDLHESLCLAQEERLLGLRLSQRIWEETLEISLGRIRCRIPGREEELLFLCLHLMKGGIFFLRSVCDLVRLLEAPAPVRWERLAYLAQETGVAAPAYYALELSGQIAPEIVPDDTLERLSHFSGPQRLLLPSLRVEKLLEKHGTEWSNLALRWRGILFAGHPRKWLVYLLRRITTGLGRRAAAVLR